MCCIMVTAFSLATILQLHLKSSHAATYAVDVVASFSKNAMADQDQLLFHYQDDRETNMSYRRIPNTKGTGTQSFDVFFDINWKTKNVEHTVELSVIWDASTMMWWCHVD